MPAPAVAAVPSPVVVTFVAFFAIRYSTPRAEIVESSDTCVIALVSMSAVATAASTALEAPVPVEFTVACMDDELRRVTSPVASRSEDPMTATCADDEALTVFTPGMEPAPGVCDAVASRSIDFAWMVAPFTVTDADAGEPPVWVSLALRSTVPAPVPPRVSIVTPEFTMIVGASISRSTPARIKSPMITTVTPVAVSMIFSEPVGTAKLTVSIAPVRLFTVI